jgi:2-oxo-hept-3-ene-1,7-dioate hydratase
MMTSEQVERVAARLIDAERRRKQIGLISIDFPDASMDDAYRVQAALVARKLAGGAVAKGWKIGLTSKAMQSALNIDIPDSGILLDDMFFADGAVVPADRFIQPRVEAEIAFVMKSALRGPDVTVLDVMNATDFVSPSLEILDTRVRRTDAATGKARTIVDTIADNAANAGIVLSPRRLRPRDVDMRWMGVIVSRNGEVEETGLGAGVLNQPAAGVAWLANRLALYGHGLAAGDVVLSGSFIRAIEARHGDAFVSDFGVHGTVRIAFA